MGKPVIHGFLPRHWYRIDATSTWVTTELDQGPGGRPLFVEGPYAMIAAAGADTFVLWSGSQVDAGVYHLCTVEGADRSPRVASPRLAHPEEVEDFLMVIEEERGDHA